MDRRLFVAGSIAATPLLSGCGALRGAFLPNYRFRLKVEIDTPNGLAAASSVIEVATSNGSGPLGSVSHRIEGEAVSIDVAPGQTLFALLRSEFYIGWATHVMFILAPEPPKELVGDDDFYARFDGMIAEPRREKTLPRTLPLGGQDVDIYPMFVRFRDPADPMTVEKVDPDALEAVFGAGVRLRRITVQMTDDPVTTGIEKRLPWLNDPKLKFVEESRDPETRHLVPPKIWTVGHNLTRDSFIGSQLDD